VSNVVDIQVSWGDFDMGSVKKYPIKIFSMFSGIGGFELGIINAIGEKAQFIGYSEIDKYAVSIYEKNIQIYERHYGKKKLQSTDTNLCRPTTTTGSEAGQCEQLNNGSNEGLSIAGGHKNYGDCTKINWGDVPGFDLLVGGFPCQAFSIAGKRLGFDDTRGTLFFEIARAIKEKRPKYFLLENVKGLLSHDSGRTFKTIITTLAELGYDLQWQVLNSKNFGVPQNRERVFIIGCLRGESIGQVFPVGGMCKENTETSTLKTIRSGYYKQGFGSQLVYKGAVMSEKNKQWLNDGKQNSRNFPQGQRVYGTEGIASTIAGNAGGLGGKTGLYEVKAVLTPDRAEKRQNGRRMKEDGEPSFTLTGQDIHGVSYENKIRRLTPTECERLQGFPDGWTEGVSDTQRYKCLGNAVSVPVIEAIIKRLYATL